MSFKKKKEFVETENLNDITSGLNSINFEHGLNEFEENYLNLRKKLHCMTVVSVSHVTYIISLLKKSKQIANDNLKTAFYTPIKIALIGCGRLGKQIVSSLLYFSDVNPKDIVISTRQPENLVNLQNMGIKCVCDNKEAVLSADVLILCFNPSSLNKVSKEIKNSIPSFALVISFLAATSTTKLIKVLNHTSIYRLELKWPTTVLDLSTWKVGNDVTTCLLSENIVDFCTPVYKVNTMQVETTNFTPPFETVEVLLYYMINMMVNLKIDPNEILNIINKVMFRDEIKLNWDNVLNINELESFYDSKKLPSFQICGLSSKESQFVSFLKFSVNEEILQCLALNFKSVFTRLYFN